MNFDAVYIDFKDFKLIFAENIFMFF